jgi:sodium-dependent dicarboxylate transporter 2/3/5
MKGIRFWGILVAAAGFLLPFFVQFGSLSVAGHIALSIFFFAAALWLTEAVPIHATSMAVIVLGAVFLSVQGPMYKDVTSPKVKPQQQADSVFVLPAAAVSTNDEVIVLQGDKQTRVKLDVMSRTATEVVVRSGTLKNESELLADINHKTAGYKPLSYTAFFGTLANPIIMLFLGGFVLAEAAVKFSIDQSLTRILLKPFGKKPIMVLTGLMLVTAVLSAFMSNTATTAMMITVVMPVIATLQPGDRFKTALVLAIPTAANIGGMATPIGTPPNAVAIGALASRGITVPFVDWMIIAGPMVIILLVSAVFLLYFLFKPQTATIELKLAEPPQRTAKTWITYVTFGGTVLLWVTESLHGINSNLVATIPIAVFAITGIIETKEIRALPWEVLWLVAGGLALGDIMDKTGLMTWMIGLVDWSGFSHTTLILVFAVVGLLMSEFLSNTVIASLLIPIGMSMGLASINATGGTLDHESISFLVMSAATIGLAVSLAMALPISTPPQAIAMSTGQVANKDMIRVGIIIGALGLILTVVSSLTFWPLVT